MGVQVATPLTSACTLGTPEELWGVLVAGQFTAVKVDKVTLDVALPDLATFVPRHLAATPMAAAFRGAGDEAVAAVVREVRSALGTGSGPTVPFRAARGNRARAVLTFASRRPRFPRFRLAYLGLARGAATCSGESQGPG